jgi:hypothetical protein
MSQVVAANALVTLGGGHQRLSKVLIVRRKLRQILEVEIDHLHRNTIL